MTKFYTFLCCTMFAGLLQAQIQQFSLGEDYSVQEFYNISTGERTTVPNESWDLAFTATGFQDAGVSINEAAALTGSELELYLSPTTSFVQSIEVADLTERLYNDDVSWESGAFNSIKDPSNPFDYGWGMYDSGSMAVQGTKVFAIKLRNGDYIKFMIESLDLTTYNLRYANLDGTNQKTASFDKMSFPTSDLVFFSFATNQAETLVDHDWDLLFSRYNTPLDDGEGGILNYVTSGVLSANGVKVGEARGIDPSTTSYSDVSGNLSSNVDAIGFDWKEFDMDNLGWIVFDDVSYFVKTADNDIYKFVFLDFEGSSTGVITLDQSEASSTSTESLLNVNKISSAYPNPNVGTFNIDLNNSTKSNQVICRIYNQNGQLVFNQEVSSRVQEGSIQLNTDLPEGSYHVQILSNNFNHSQTVFIVK